MPTIVRTREKTSAQPCAATTRNNARWTSVAALLRTQVAELDVPSIPAQQRQPPRHGRIRNGAAELKVPSNRRLFKLNIRSIPNPLGTEVLRMQAAELDVPSIPSPLTLDIPSSTNLLEREPSKRNCRECRTLSSTSPASQVHSIQQAQPCPSAEKLPAAALFQSRAASTALLTMEASMFVGRKTQAFAR